MAIGEIDGLIHRFHRACAISNAEQGRNAETPVQRQTSEASQPNTKRQCKSRSQRMLIRCHHRAVDEQTGGHGQRNQRPHRPQQLQSKDGSEVPPHGLSLFLGIGAEHRHQTAKRRGTSGRCCQRPQQHDSQDKYSLLDQESGEASAKDVPQSAVEQPGLECLYEEFVYGGKLEAVEKKANGNDAQCQRRKTAAPAPHKFRRQKERLVHQGGEAVTKRRMRA